MARILITSGPTRQYLDPVRFLTNASSGRMGAALARAALDRGAVPVVVSGPVAIDYPEGTERHDVVTTEEMLGVCRDLFPGCIGVIGAAAPCDFQPEQPPTGEKWHKHSEREADTGQPALRPASRTIVLVETPDILQALATIKRPGQWMLAFALETHDGRTRAFQKLRRKGADLIALNDPTAIDAVTTRLELIDAAGQSVRTLAGEKTEVAGQLLELLLGFEK